MLLESPLSNQKLPPLHWLNCMNISSLWKFIAYYVAMFSILSVAIVVYKLTDTHVNKHYYFSWHYNNTPLGWYIMTSLLPRHYEGCM